MLNLDAGDAGLSCDGIPRRNFLHVGSLGLGGLTLADILHTRASANPVSRGTHDKGVSVVLLFLGGGPSQLETFDPKPEGIGTSTSIAGHLGTSLAGERFAAYLPKLATHAHELSVVKSFQTHHAEHNGAHKQIMTADLSVQDGKPIRQPGMGAMATRVTGPQHPRTGLPTHVVIPPTTKHIPKASGFAGSYESIVEGCQPAGLGAAYAPFEIKVPMAEGQPRAKKSKRGQPHLPHPLIDNLTPRIASRHQQSRLDLLAQLDRFNRLSDAGQMMASMDEYTRRAVELLKTDDVRRALDLSLEDRRTLAAYDTEHFRNYKADESSKFLRNGPSIGISLGRQLLLARRLCEAGSRFVTVIHANWDFHARKGIPNIPEGMSVLAPPLDHAVSAFLTDLKQRGLTEKILLVITGEFGRTPKLDDNLGRHHWPRICPLVFAGGGLQHGQIVGQSDRRGGEPATEPYTIADLHTTILHAMFDIGQLRLDATLPDVVLARVQNGRPITELF